jgi:hypothetical protein
VSPILTPTEPGLGALRCYTGVVVAEIYRKAVDFYTSTLLLAELSQHVGLSVHFYVDYLGFPCS